MLSDVLIAMLDSNDTADPIEDYLAALRLFEGVAGDVDVFIPGHGSVGGTTDLGGHQTRDSEEPHIVAGEGFEPSTFGL